MYANVCGIQSTREPEGVGVHGLLCLIGGLQCLLVLTPVRLVLIVIVPRTWCIVCRRYR